MRLIFRDKLIRICKRRILAYGKGALDNVKKEQPIGVFDSGLGGISVLRELVSLLPKEDFIYFGDAAHAPYGERTEREIRALTTVQIDRMAAEGVKAVVLACNTATSAACAPLRRRYRQMPIIGMEPALKPAILSGEKPRVVVMATHATLRQKKFARLMERFKDAGDIVKLPCPEIVEFVECGEIHSAALHESSLAARIFLLCAMRFKMSWVRPCRFLTVRRVRLANSSVACWKPMLCGKAGRRV